MSNRAIPAVALACAVAALIGSCGGNEAKLVSAQELVTRADAACTAEQADFARIQSQPPAGATQAADQTGELADAVGDELSELEKMKAPDPQSARYDRYVAAIRDAKGLLENGANAAGGQDSKAYGAAQSKLAAGKPERRKLAAKLGFDHCSPLGGSGA